MQILEVKTDHVALPFSVKFQEYGGEVTTLHRGGISSTSRIECEFYEIMAMDIEHADFIDVGETRTLSMAIDSSEGGQLGWPESLPESAAPVTVYVRRIA